MDALALAQWKKLVEPHLQRAGYSSTLRLPAPKRRRSLSLYEWIETNGDDILATSAASKQERSKMQNVHVPTDVVRAWVDFTSGKWATLPMALFYIVCLTVVRNCGIGSVAEVEQAWKIVQPQVRRILLNKPPSAQTLQAFAIHAIDGVARVSQTNHLTGEVWIAGATAPYRYELPLSAMKIFDSNTMVLVPGERVLLTEQGMNHATAELVSEKLTDMLRDLVHSTSRSLIHQHVEYLKMVGSDEFLDEPNDEAHMCDVILQHMKPKSRPDVIADIEDLVVPPCMAKLHGTILHGNQRQRKDGERPRYTARLAAVAFYRESGVQPTAIVEAVQKAYLRGAQDVSEDMRKHKIAEISRKIREAPTFSMCCQDCSIFPSATKCAEVGGVPFAKDEYPGMFTPAKMTNRLSVARSAGRRTHTPIQNNACT
jgi:hypothetical protein